MTKKPAKFPSHTDTPLIKWKGGSYHAWLRENGDLMVQKLVTYPFDPDRPAQQASGHLEQVRLVPWDGK